MLKKNNPNKNSNLYSGRENMNLFGYKKWERFEGVVSRMENNVSKNFFDENIYINVDKTTGGRPRKDILFTIEGARELVSYCDQRKDEVGKLKKHLDEDIYKKLNEKTFSSKSNNFYLGLSFFISIFVILFYLIFLNFNFIFNSVFYNNGSDLNDDLLKNTLTGIENQVNNDIIDEYNIGDNENEDFYTQSDAPIINDEFFSYIRNDGGDILFYDMNLNPRSEFTRNLSGVNLIKAFFEFGNHGFYRDSCSLLNKSRCYSGINSNLSGFSNFWQKTFDGHEIIEINKVQSGISSNRYCVKYKYNLKYDTNRESVIETFNFTTNIIGGIEEINSRFCEKIQKNGKNIPCPFELNNYYCDL